MAHMEKLAQYEKASNEPIIVHQGKESADFWQAFGLESRPETAYTTDETFNQLYIDVSETKSTISYTLV